MSTRTDRRTPRQVFDRLASEYYDEVKHPTTATFRAASDRLLRPWVRGLMHSMAVVCEVGAGKSSILPLIAQGCSRPAQLLLIDFSLGMLRHTPSGSSFAYPVIADAERLPISAGTVDLLVAPLGAPFNCEMFWQEAARVIRPGCHAIYTGPAHEWALRFRNGDPVAEYRVDDTVLRVPSWTRTVADQTRLTSGAGLDTINEARVRLSALGQGMASPKITLRDDDPFQDPVVVDGILVRKSAE